MIEEARPLALTIDEFCSAVRISRAMYYALDGADRPIEMRVGPRRVLISRRAAEAWIAERESRSITAAVA